MVGIRKFEPVPTNFHFLGSSKDFALYVVHFVRFSHSFDFLAAKIFAASRTILLLKFKHKKNEVLQVLATPPWKFPLPLS